MSVTLSDLRRRFNVNWMTLLVGWRGFAAYQRLVKISDIQQFAIENLETVSKSSPLLPDLAVLATIPEQEDYQIVPLLEKLSATEHNDFETEVKKWTICLLKKTLQELPDAYVEGLLELTDFWASLQFPDYSPHQIQGVGNNITPQQYYTRENYRNEVERHKNWIEEECRKLSVH